MPLPHLAGLVGADNFSNKRLPLLFVFSVLIPVPANFCTGIKILFLTKNFFIYIYKGGLYERNCEFFDLFELLAFRWQFRVQYQYIGNKYNKYHRGTRYTHLFWKGSVCELYFWVIRLRLISCAARKLHNLNELLLDEKYRRTTAFRKTNSSYLEKILEWLKRNCLKSGYNITITRCILSTCFVKFF